MIAADEAKRLLDYRSETGEFFWRTSRGNVIAGSRAGHIQRSRGRKTNTEYMVIRIGRLYMAHVLAWLITTGEFPNSSIDHKDGNSLNNKFGNLRIATSSENSRNSKRRHDNKSGFKGVSWDKINNKWVARIRSEGGKYLNLGRFNDANLAHDAYRRAALKFHGEFARAE